MDEPNPLGSYLRARRGLVRPEDAGIRVTGLRRVPGLRREEVATLAGVSADYYLRLEQGRDRNPSAQVLDALADVLQLDEAAAAHLRSLAAEPSRRAPTRSIAPERVPTGVLQLLESIGLPSFVEGRMFDVLATNRLGTALSPRLRPGGNRLRDVFLDPDEQALWVGADRLLPGLVAGFRASVGTRTDDPRCVALVGELSLRSERFRQLWARQDVQRREGAPTRVDHPLVGGMTVLREKLVVSGTDGMMLVVYHAEPGSRSAESHARLGTDAESAAAPDSAALPESVAIPGSEQGAATGSVGAGHDLQAN